MLIPASAYHAASSIEQHAVVVCTHCQLPVPAGLIQQGVTEQFCCNGCQSVWQLLHSEGLEAFYTICNRVESRPGQVPKITEEMTEYDDKAFQDLYVRTVGEKAREVKLVLEGLHCAACVWLIEKLPRLCPGIIAARVQLVGQQAVIQWNPGAVKLSQIARYIAKLGYLPHPATDDHRLEAQKRENRQQLQNLGVAGLCAGNAMLVAFALYGGIFDGISQEYATLLRWVSTGLGIVSLIWPGATFFRGAWRSLRTRTPHMDISLAIGLAAGGVLGVINTILGRGEIYFDSLCMLIFVLLIGRYLQFRQQQRTVESLTLLNSLIPRLAFRIQPDGQVMRVATSSLQPGDEVEIRVGDLVPADGVILRGKSTLDQSLLTGESVGVSVNPGESITAGATNLSEVLRVRVAAIGKSSRIGRLMDLVESISTTRVPIIELANRISGIFLYVVLLLACCTLMYWWGTEPEAAVNHVIALLIVACPCALGLATPMTIAIAQGRAARQKILIRQGDVFERLQNKGRLWIDKTGTLTEGKLRLEAWYGDESIIPHVIALETGIMHPLAQALCRALRKRVGNVVISPSIEHQRYVAGRGVSGSVNSIILHLGTRGWMEENGVDMSNEEHWHVDTMLKQGWTPVYVARDQHLVAVAALGDSIRPEAKKSLQELQQQGWSIGILSGDHQVIVDRVAQQLDIPRDMALGQLSPEDKLAVVQRGLAHSPVVMVGDGINDSAALAAASVGIAVHGGAECAMQAAPVYLGQPGLEPLVELMNGSFNTMSAIRRGLVVSLAYNITAISLAMAGLITPLVAAILMPISSLTVTLLALNQNTFRRKP